MAGNLVLVYQRMPVLAEGVRREVLGLLYGWMGLSVAGLSGLGTVVFYQVVKLGLAQRLPVAYVWETVQAFVLPGGALGLFCWRLVTLTRGYRRGDMACFLRLKRMFGYLTLAIGAVCLLGVFGGVVQVMQGIPGPGLLWLWVMPLVVGLGGTWGCMRSAGRQAVAPG